MTQKNTNVKEYFQGREGVSVLFVSQTTPVSSEVSWVNLPLP